MSLALPPGAEDAGPGPGPGALPEASPEALLAAIVASTSDAIVGMSLDGRVRLDWRHEAGRLVLSWRESGGPPLAGVPRVRGFGSRLIADVPRGKLRAEVETDFAAGGLCWTLRCPAGEALA